MRVRVSCRLVFPREGTITKNDTDARSSLINGHYSSLLVIDTLWLLSLLWFLEFGYWSLSPPGDVPEGLSVRCRRSVLDRCGFPRLPVSREARDPSARMHPSLSVSSPSFRDNALSHQKRRFRSGRRPWLRVPSSRRPHRLPCLSRNPRRSSPPSHRPSNTLQDRKSVV